jgi:hypothetical protein
MSEAIIQRENQIFDTLHAFNAADLAYVVVGGYAVSAFAHRFSVDADLVIRDEDLDAFAEILQDRGYAKAIDKDLDVYGGRFVAYEQDAELPVSIDLLVNGLTSRQTDATWRYDYLREHAAPREIQGSEQAVTAHVPEKELLIAVKLHSGRLTDVRDVVALAENADFDAVTTHWDRGDVDRRGDVLADALATLTSADFADAFKGVFSRQETPEHMIERVRTFLTAQRDAYQDRNAG